jgi:hypothetical protein
LMFRLGLANPLATETRPRQHLDCLRTSQDPRPCRESEVVLEDGKDVRRFVFQV